MSHISDLIRDARACAGMTQAELARRLGTDQPTVSRWERGERQPRARTLERLFRVLKIRG